MIYKKVKEVRIRLVSVTDLLFDSFHYVARHWRFLYRRLLFSALLTIELPGDIDASWFRLQRCVPVALYLV